ncbi:peptide-methionine (S)-S-oxide reductase MsrA [Cellulophaga lytica]|uniref:Peptide methionine sulfoxide reductase MsrA n=1 Tax=Cellulophaga lytica (strain ATCC 23178 / DSM 7489 / JCM 8516 / NBRC 14961 / NCIMB 1423 / VKM B-1433 / Cy l20) TaxID=867900 RepID=F0RFE3_CELLC|nr:peptide-methionine (S)-S-oxide reductase MsrA [Cellulophaga lytica]ADY27885.1 Peptide methionine sulfoxide reductase msrA [Cellulophaga lytica DSM 7489]WQG77923.1 peptide-methionine (S)-S-oxide reductase MsrA [Cellulophaga lytica]
MRIVKVALLLSTILISTSCSSKNNTKKETSTEAKAETKTVIQDLSSYETAYFASGCFWCVEAVFESVKGVKEVISGYAGGKEKNPTYEQVGSGNSTHAEAVVVYYNPKQVSYATLVKVFFGSQDPTTLNRQGPDKGTQYRSIAFYKNKQEQKIITDYVAKLTKEKVFSSKIVTEITPFTTFYKAEGYHQDYEKKHPNNPYIKNVSIPRLNRFKSKFPELLKKDSH